MILLSSLPTFLAPVLATSFVALATPSSQDFQTPACTAGSCELTCVEPDRYAASPSIVLDRDGTRWERETRVHLAQADAFAYCASLDLDGTTGWRLPEAPELASLRYEPAGLGAGHAPTCTPSIDQAAFPATPPEPFWTARTRTDGTGWYIGFDDGRAHWSPDTEAFAVRCVHDPI